MLKRGSVHIVSLGRLCFLFGLINSLKYSSHLTWNKKSQASLSADPAPVGFAPAQQGAAPKTQRREYYYLLFFFTPIREISRLLFVRKM